jgi:NAD(P)-dependent dehydrogenase (short-subunit alcohol dehydrogenase family)
MDAHWLKVVSGIALRGVSDRTLRHAVTGKVVLVTGASEGIGAATAVRLGAAGAIVLLAARTEETLALVRDEITALGGVAHVYPTDLSDPEQAEALAEAILRDHRRIDVVVSNAGRSIRRSLADTSDRFHDVVRTIDLNYLGPVRLLLALVPAMRAAGGGHIVNVSTAGVFTPAQNWSSYLASKSAFDVWLRCAAPELRRDGVTVSTFYSGLVRTRMSAPTAYLRRYPAMTAQEAAGAVCRAIARRPRTLQAWWTRPGELIAATFKGPVERMMAFSARLTPLRSLSILDIRRVILLAWAGRRYGWTLTAAASGGRRDEVALIDRDGPATRGELRAAARACAVGMREELGVRAGDRVGVRCATHRGLAIAACAAGLLGADAVLLPPHLDLAQIVAAERLTALVTDPGTEPPAGVRSAPWSVLATHSGRRLPRPQVRGRLTVLTSGTTGDPRVVRRKLTWRALLGPALAHLRHIPVRRGRPILVATPAYHGYGLTYLAAGLALAAPVLLVAGRDPAAVLTAAGEHRPTALFALPAQLAALVEVPGAADLPAGTRIVTGAEPLDPELSQRLLEVFGDRVFNLFGSTEAGWAALATPADLRAAPGTVGRAPAGVSLRILDSDGRPVPPGEVGAVHVAGWLPGGELVPTGDLGHLDRAGRLMLDGRVDGSLRVPVA